MTDELLIQIVENAIIIIVSTQDNIGTILRAVDIRVNQE